jgi:hypothetical protein
VPRGISPLSSRQPLYRGAATPRLGVFPDLATDALLLSVQPGTADPVFPCFRVGRVINVSIVLIGPVSLITFIVLDGINRLFELLSTFDDGCSISLNHLLCRSNTYDDGRFNYLYDPSS